MSKVVQPISDRIFWSAYIDLDNDKIVPTSRNSICNSFFDLLADLGTYSNFLEVYTNNFVAEPYREILTEALEPYNIRAAIKNNRICSINYGAITTDGNQRRMAMTVFSADGDFNGGKYTITASSVDNEYNILTQLEEYEDRFGSEDNKSKAQIMMLQGLDAIFYSITLVNLVHNTFQEIVSGEGIHPVVQDYDEAQQALDLCQERFVSAQDKVQMQEFLDLSTVSMRLAYQKSISTEFFSANGKWVRVIFLAVTRDQDNAAQEVLLITRIIDEEKKAQLKYQTSLENALNDLYESREKLALAFSQKSEQLDDAQTHDNVTKLLNMREFLRLADEYIANVPDEELSQYVIIYENIRHFKHFNSKYGTEKGDELLRFVGEEIRSFPGAVYTTRIEADHFASLVRLDEVQEQLHPCFVSVNMKYQADNLRMEAGYYRLQDHTKNVYYAMELAKAACFSVFAEKQILKEYDKNLERKLQVERYVLNSVNEAIENGWIKVYYQPVVSTMTGDVCGYEALARWIDPVHGFLSPGDFIPVLEKSGNIYKIDQCVIREVCKLIRSFADTGRKMVPVSINLSRIDFIKCDIVAYVEEVTKEFGVPRNMLNIEVTETIMMSDEKTMQGHVKRFRDLGYQVWMDDFGSGYSSLNVLKNFSFDEIKLDMGFMRDFDVASRHIIEAMISMIRKMGMVTLAEGVETEEQYEFLKAVGCERIQGYYIDKPKPINL